MVSTTSGAAFRIDCLTFSRMAWISCGNILMYSSIVAKRFLSALCLLPALLSCHSERSEESAWSRREILRCAQNDRWSGPGARSCPGLVPDCLVLLPSRIRIRVINQLHLSLFRVHRLAPGLLAHFRARVLDRFCDGLAGCVKIDAEQVVVVFDHITVYHHGMHISAPGLEDDVAVGVENREHRWRLLVLNQHKVGLFAGGDAAGEAIHAQRRRAAERG